MEPPPLEAYFDAIHRAFESLPVSYSSELWCEPGRALCAEYSSIIVRVEKRRGAELYINDGAYGALFDAAHIGWRFPVQLLREPESDVRDHPFSFYGPTCDDLDHMAGPFLLPADVQAGDYIEIGMLGAYGCGDADRVQRLRLGRDGDRRRTSRWPASTPSLEPARPQQRRHAVTTDQHTSSRARRDPLAARSSACGLGFRVPETTAVLERMELT